MKKLISILAATAITVFALNHYLTPSVLASLSALKHDIPWALIITSLLLVALTQFLRAWRFKVMVDGQLAPPNMKLFQITSILALMNLLLPFRLGELSFPILMKRFYDFGLVRGMGTLLLVRILDLLASVSLFAFCAWLLHVEIGHMPHDWFLVIGAVSVSAFFCIPYVGPAAWARLNRAAEPWPKLSNLNDRLFHAANSIESNRQKMMVLVLTLAIWVSLLSIAYAAAKAIMPSVNVLEGFFAGAAGSISFALPVNGFAGIGLMQSAWAYALTLVGHEWSIGIAAGILWNGVLLTGSGVVAMMTAASGSKDAGRKPVR